MTGPTLRPHPTRRRLTRAALLLALVAAPTTAQYRDAGTGLDVVPNRKQQLEKAMEDARWHLGAIRIAPWIGLRDVSYVREVDATGEQRPSDLTVTAGAGLKAYLKLGPQSIAAAHALPEYTWWRRQGDRDAFVGRYGLGLFGWATRLQGELTARRVEQVSFLAPDLLVRAPVRSDELAAQAQLRLFGSIALFAGGGRTETRVEAASDLTALDPALVLDRDHDIYRGGLRYLLRADRGHVGAGVFAERTTFLGADAQRSNDGSGWYVESAVTGNNLDMKLRYDQRDLEADESSFPGYSAGNGLASVTVHPGWRLRYQLYALRELRYTALSSSTFLEEQRTGGTVACAIGDGSLRLFYERGDDDYFGAGARHESVTAYGASIELPIRALDLRLGGRQTEFTPDLGARREIEELTLAIGLTLGQPGEW